MIIIIISAPFALFAFIVCLWILFLKKINDIILVEETMDKSYSLKEKERKRMQVEFSKRQRQNYINQNNNKKEELNEK